MFFQCGKGGVKPAAAAQPEVSGGEIRLQGGNWRLQRASEVEDSGKTMSVCGYDDSDWLVATVPGTSTFMTQCCHLKKTGQYRMQTGSRLKIQEGKNLAWNMKCLCNSFRVPNQPISGATDSRRIISGDSSIWERISLWPDMLSCRSLTAILPISSTICPIRVMDGSR